MKRLPKTVTINGKPWRVVLKPLFAKGFYGLCLRTAREIQIDDTITGDEREETFLHELMHACIRERVSDEAEERLVDRMAPRLLAALKSAGWIK